MASNKAQKGWGRANTALEAEIQALRALKRHKRAFLKVVDLLQSCRGTILVSGVGKSAHVGSKIASTLTSLGHRSAFLDPVHALHGDAGFVSAGDVLVAISFSGSSREVLKVAEHLKKEFDVKIVALTGKTNSSLASLSDAVMPLSVRSEGSPLDLAPMASSAATLAVGDMLAAALTDPKTFEKKHFARFHPGGDLGFQTKSVSERMTKQVPTISAGAPFSDALRTITKYKKGIVGVLDKKKKLIGAITDGDVRRFVMSNSDTARATAKDAMSKKPKSVETNTTLAEALQRMEKYKITSLFVSKSGRPVGLVHMHDILS